MARLKHCRGGTRAALAGLWAGLVAVSVLCACALAGAWLSAQWRVWLLCAAAVCAIACPCLGAAIRRIASGRRGEKQACAVLKSLPAGYTVLCNVPMQANGRKTELDAAVAGPGGVCVVEVKHYAGDVFGTENAAAWRQARPGKGGRRIEKSVPNPVAQNRRQVAKGHFCLFFLRRRAAGLPVAPLLKTKSPWRPCLACHGPFAFMALSAAQRHTKTAVLRNRKSFTKRRLHSYYVCSSISYSYI